MTTWLSSEEIMPTRDKDFAPLLADIERATGERWVVLPCKERSRTKILSYLRALVDPPQARYSLYFHLGGNEYQVINFYLEHSRTSLNTLVPKAVVMAYLLGLLGQAQKGAP